jgi:carbonic anhydrase
MWKLMEGIILFREVMPKYAQRFRKLASNQPDALFIVCSDSRVVPNLVTSTHPDDGFTMRNVGN